MKAFAPAKRPLPKNNTPLLTPAFKSKILIDQEKNPYYNWL